MYQRIHCAITLGIKLFECSLTSAPSFPAFWQLRWAAAWFDISCRVKKGAGIKIDDFTLSSWARSWDQSRLSYLHFLPTPPLPLCTLALYSNWRAAFAETDEEWSATRVQYRNLKLTSGQHLISPIFLPYIILTLKCGFFKRTFAQMHMSSKIIIISHFVLQSEIIK